MTRAANVFGYGDVGTTRGVPLFITTALLGADGIPLRYKRNRRQFIYVTDVIAGYLRAAARLNEVDPTLRDPTAFPTRNPFTPTFHFAIEDYSRPGQPCIRMNELAQTVASVCRGRLHKTDGCVDRAPNENPVQALNCQPTRNQLGWEARTTLEEGIDHLADWYRSTEDCSALSRMLCRDVQTVLDGLN